MVYVIGEAGVCHNGSLEMAKRLADAALDSGCDYVKYQAWKTELLMTKESEDYELAKSLELSFKEFRELKKYCDEIGITFLCTPDDEKSLNFLADELKVSAIKVGSGELNNLPFLEKIARKGLPIILSTGMGTMKEVENAVQTIIEAGNDQITLLHCTSSYPAPLKEVNLKAMINMKERFNLPVGYSDHTKGMMAGFCAALLRAKIIEKHFTINKRMKGPDHKASLNPKELKEFVDNIRLAEKIIGHGIKAPSDSENINRLRVRKSIVASKDIRKGEVFTIDMLAFKRPGDGMSPDKAGCVLGKRASCDIRKDEKIMLAKEKGR